MVDKSASHATTRTRMILDPANLAIDCAKVVLPMTALSAATPRVFCAGLLLLQQLPLSLLVDLVPPK